MRGFLPPTTVVFSTYFAFLITAVPKWSWPSRNGSKFRATLDGVLDGKIDIAHLVGSFKPSLLFQKRAPKVSTAINIDNEASDGFTIVEVFTEDRIGVLFTITYSLHRLGLSIHVAKISTNVDQVADVFYVTDHAGGKSHRAGAGRNRAQISPS